MTTLAARIIRIKVDLDSFEPLVDVATSQPPKSWNGSDVVFQLGLFRGANAVDPSTVSSLTIRIGDFQNRQATPYVEATAAGAEIDLTMDASTWGDGTKQHLEIPVTAENMTFGLGGNEKTFWLAVGVVTTDVPALHLSLGGGPFVVVEPGATTSPGGGTFLTEAQSDARYIARSIAGSSFRLNAGGQHLQLYNATTGLWHTIFCDGAAGSVALVIEQTGEA